MIANVQFIEIHSILHELTKLLLPQVRSNYDKGNKVYTYFGTLLLSWKMSKHLIENALLRNAYIYSFIQPHKIPHFS